MLQPGDVPRRGALISGLAAAVLVLTPAPAPRRNQSGRLSSRMAPSSWTVSPSPSTTRTVASRSSIHSRWRGSWSVPLRLSASVSGRQTRYSLTRPAWGRRRRASWAERRGRTGWATSPSPRPSPRAPRDEEEVAALVRQAAERGAACGSPVRGTRSRRSSRPAGCGSTSRRCAACWPPTPSGACDRARRYAGPRLLRAAVGGRPRAAQPGRHRHPADRRGGGHRDARLGDAVYQPVGVVRGPAAGDRDG